VEGKLNHLGVGEAVMPPWKLDSHLYYSGCLFA
jgi:hypothetical protein